jgi:hypothetical protein
MQTTLTTPRRCLTCGYDLRGLSSSRCPECGESIPTAPGAIPVSQLPAKTILNLAMACALLLFAYAGALLFLFILFATDLNQPRIWLALPVLALMNSLGMFRLARRRWPGDRWTLGQSLLIFAGLPPLAGSVLLACAFYEQRTWPGQLGLALMITLAACPALTFSRLRFVAGWTDDPGTARAAGDLAWGLAVPVTLTSAIAIPYLLTQFLSAPILYKPLSALFLFATAALLLFYGWALLVLFNSWARFFRALRPDENECATRDGYIR